MLNTNLLILILLVDIIWLLLELGITEQILKPLVGYYTSRQLEQIKPYYDRIKQGYTQLDNSLMTDNHLIDFMFEGLDYVYANIIPSIASDLSEDEQVIIAEHIVDYFDGNILLEKVAAKKNVVEKQINSNNNL